MHGLQKKAWTFTRVNSRQYYDDDGCCDAIKATQCVSLHNESDGDMTARYWSGEFFGVGHQRQQDTGPPALKTISELLIETLSMAGTSTVDTSSAVLDLSTGTCEYDTLS